MSESAPPTETVRSDGAEARLRAPWQRVLRICIAAFLLWLLLDAPTLQHNAQVSPVGTRRTVSLDLLGPIAATSRALQVSHIVSWTDEATGRTGNRPGNGALTTLGPVHKHGSRPVKPSSGGHTTDPSTTGSNPATGTTVPDITHPTSADPLRVLILGDSLGIDLGGPLQNDLVNTGVVKATLDARESTGLTRPDYFNWPAELQSDLNATHPQIVVIMMGANDPQDFPGPPDVPFTSAQWNVMYAQRVAAFMRLAQGAGATVIWVGMPPMQNTALSAKMSDLDTVDQQQAAARKPAVDFVSSWTLLGTAQGTYAPFITNAAGQVVNVRTPDGIHLTPAGGEVLSQTVLNYLRGPLHFDLP